MLSSLEVCESTHYNSMPGKEQRSADHRRLASRRRGDWEIGGKMRRTLEVREICV